MKTDIKNDGMWWSHVETCDRCGNQVQGHEVRSSCEPNMEEADFCYECLRYLMKEKIPYEDAKKQYK